MYYGLDSAAVSSRKEDPLDIDGTGFKPEKFLEHLLKESSLNELFERERQMRRGSIMNKWISSSLECVLLPLTSASPLPHLLHVHNYCLYMCKYMYILAHTYTYTCTHYNG